MNDSLIHWWIYEPFCSRAANEKFNKLLDEVKLSSEKLEADLDKKDRFVYCL